MTQALGAVDVVTLFIPGLDESIDFYRRVFGVELVYTDESSAVFQFSNLLINLLVDSNAASLISPAPVAASGAGNRFQFTIDVDNVDRVCDTLTALGVELLNGPMDRPWGIRSASFKDPGGHIWEISHELAPVQ